MNQSVINNFLPAVLFLFLTACSGSDSPQLSNDQSTPDVSEQPSTPDDNPVDSETADTGSDIGDTPIDGAADGGVDGNEPPDDEPAANIVANGYALVRAERMRPDGSVFGVVEFAIDYDGNTLTRLSSYPDGINSLTAHEMLKYDEAGNLTARQHIGDSAEDGVREQYVYNTAGYMTNLNAYFLEDDRQFSAYEYSYRPDGKIERKIDEDETTTIIIDYAYDDSGRLLSSNRLYQNSASSNDLTLTVVFEQSVDSNEILRAEAVEDNGDSVSGYSEYQYDASGNLVQIDWFREDGEPWFVDIFYYEPTPEPIYNYWLYTRQFFPEEMRHPL